MDFALRPPTRFAPADREAIERIREEREMVLMSAMARSLHEDAHGCMAVINEDRQVVHANAAFVAFAQCKSDDDLLGLRLGELLGCVHATEDVSGCGTHPTCRTCGTVNSAMTALEGRACTTEVNLVVERQGKEVDLAFDLTATPVAIRGRCFVLIEVEPVSE